MAAIEQIAAAIRRVEEDPTVGTRAGAPMIQTRRVAAALRALGIPRSEFSARVTYETQAGVRCYGEAIGSPKTRAAAELVEQNAQALAACGLKVFLVGERSHFITSGGAPHGHVRDLRNGAA